ncbi:MAG: hypothetical protein LKG38_05160 [Atopobiaceae bacterium]|jgi:hypothetical protein|nr:hypothetical protein [Atopobiaceae bacterium]MCH4120200.1 hypothetical protein [Atopobiaceae bacterium]MCI1318714.1 hypothetical protein [Atopobiaceae bacterium]MCI1389765.1 hypothetical protein [Atopobiaceae bacterium]MCI1432477.1 hypothetical protein [Atopobiaceae bacterium]
MAKATPAGETPRFSGNYTLDSMAIDSAADAMDSDRTRTVLLGITIASLAAMIVVLIQQPPNYWLWVAACFIVSMAGGVASNETHRIQLRRLAAGGLIIPHSIPDPSVFKCHFEVFPDRIHMVGPGSSDTTYQIADIKKFWCDEDAIVLRFANKEYLVIPRTSMSNSRYLNLIDMLDKATK